MLNVRCLILVGVLLVASRGLAKEVDLAGRAFLGWEQFSSWTQVLDLEGDRVILNSPSIHLPIEFDQLVLSWNIRSQAASQYTFSVAIRVGTLWSNDFVLGHWARGSSNELRTSRNGQRDGIARVLTDTLMLAEPAREIRIRVERKGASSGPLELAFAGVSVLDTRIETRSRESSRKAWGTELAVPQLCQMDYMGGEVWCSPTSVGMVLSHWGIVLSRPELRRSVPSIASEVFDVAWEGTGNWPFNTAFAGAFEGIRGYVARLGDVTDLEAWIDAGVPVTVSVGYSVLKRSAPRANDGHLIVCVGFTETGDIIVNDPARRGSVRWVYDRSDFVSAWARSRNTAYLIYPESFEIPKDTRKLWAVGSF